ncbi:MAG: DNA polymerase III subunit delta [Campylobacterota bacterium]|nr:DNA polymerase III subunit delta [Campylobacterota bacterium]
MKYKNDLDKAISLGSVPRAFMLFGESHFLIDNYLKQLSHLDEVSELNFYYDEYDFNRAKAHLSQASLFGDKNLVVIKSEKKIPKKDLDTLIDLVSKNSDNYLFYAYFGSDMKSSATAFTPKKGADNIRLFHPSFNEARGLIAQSAFQKGVKIDGAAIEHLLVLHNNDLSLSINELDKLAILDNEITSKDIDRLVYGLSEVKLDKFVISILQKKSFVDELYRLLETGEDEVRIVTSLSNFLQELYMFYVYIKIHGFPNSREILGYQLPKFVETERSNLSIKFKQKSYESALTLLLKAQLQLKSSHNDKISILIQALIKLQATL